MRAQVTSYFLLWIQAFSSPAPVLPSHGLCCVVPGTQQAGTSCPHLSPPLQVQGSVVRRQNLCKIRPAVIHSFIHSFNVLNKNEALATCRQCAGNREAGGDSQHQPALKNSTP